MVRKIALAIALAVLTLTFLAPAAPAAGYIGSPSYAPGTTLSYCIHINSGFDANMRSLIHDGMEDLDSKTNLNFDYVGPLGNGTMGCILADWKIIVDYGVAAAGFNYTDNDIHINPNAFWWGRTGYTGCRFPVGSDGAECPSYARTMIRQEAMHGIGFDHSDNGTQLHCAFGTWWLDNGVSTWDGYYSTETVAACDTYGERLMYTYAGDGFYRGFHADELNGIAAFGY